MAILAAAGIAALLLALPPAAFAGIPGEVELAAGRAHVESLREKEKSLRADLDDVITSIPTLRQDIENAGKEYEERRNEWRASKAVASRGASWEDISEHETDEKEMRAARQHIDNLRDELADHIKRKGELLKDWRLAAWRADRAQQDLKVNSTRAAQTASVGVYLSSTCRILGPPDCPSMGQLISLDQSLPGTGKFRISNVTGTWERGPSPYHNAHRLYHGDETPRLIIDPPARLSKDLRMIFIEPDVPPTAPENVYVEIGQAWEIHAVPFLHTRLADRHCTIAIVAAGPEWRERLADSAAWLRSACRAPSNVSTIDWLAFPVEPMDPRALPEWQRQREAAAVEQACHDRYGACPTVPLPEFHDRPWVGAWPHLARLNEGRPAPRPTTHAAIAHAEIQSPMPILRPQFLEPARSRTDPMRPVRAPLQGARMGHDRRGRSP